MTTGTEVFYLDTSVLVAATTREGYSHRTQDWLASVPLQSLIISPWVITEYHAALALKQRTQQITGQERSGAIGYFRQILKESLTVVPVQERHFLQAADLVDRHLSGLRGPDALHLAIARDQGAVLATLDRDLASAGSREAPGTVLVAS